MRNSHDGAAASLSSRAIPDCVRGGGDLLELRGSMVPWIAAPPFGLLAMTEPNAPSAGVARLRGRAWKSGASALAFGQFLTPKPLKSPLRRQNCASSMRGSEALSPPTTAKPPPRGAPLHRRTVPFLVSRRRWWAFQDARAM